MKTLLSLVVALLASLPTIAAQGPPLRIVVLAGEDSVNVIQQKTAVAPLVEVRDRNNNPVSGAVVTFAVQGGRAAAFQGGATTMTIATNAAGQAAATGLTPLTAGAVNISVEAAFQGQIVTAAISQVNVMTAAEVAAAAGATGAGSGTSAAGASGGAAGGTGGGLSATTLGVVGGVAAAGAVAATQVGGDDPVIAKPIASATYSGPFSGTTTLPFQGCNRQERYFGTLEVTIAEHADTASTITGSARVIAAANVVVATTCTGGLQVGQTANWGMPQTSVGGSEANVTFQSQDVVPSAAGGSLSRVFSFRGSLSGTALSGVFDFTWSGSDLLTPTVVRADVTLTKQ